MSVVTPRKSNRCALIVVGLVVTSALAACGRSDTEANSKPDEPAAVSAPAAQVGGDAPLGESTRSASAADSATAPAEAANTMQTAAIAPPQVVKAAAPVAADTSDDDTDKSASKLSAEQQELAAEVGDTRHAAAAGPSSSSTSSDKTPD